MAIPAITFSPPTTTLYNDEVFVPITQNEVENIQMGRYMISNYGRIFDTYINLFTIGYLTGDIMYVDIICDNTIMKVNLIELIAKIFYTQTNPYARLKDRRTRILFHKDNIEWTDVDKDIRDQDKNIVYINNQRIHCGEGSTFQTKLTDEKVHQICKLLEEDKLSQTEIADMFHITKDTIFRIKAGDNWKHISKNYNIPKVIPRGEGRGTANPKSKYNDEQVREVCKLLEKHQYQNIEIAKMVGVHKQFVSTVKNRKGWTHISKDYDF